MLSQNNGRLWACLRSAWGMKTSNDWGGGCAGCHGNVARHVTKSADCTENDAWKESCTIVVLTVEHVVQTNRLSCVARVQHWFGRWVPRCGCSPRMSGTVFQLCFLFLRKHKTRSLFFSCWNSGSSLQVGKVLVECYHNLCSSNEGMFCCV